MNSLKWSLLAWLILLYLVSAALDLAISHHQYKASINAFMDGQMHALALSYTRQLASDGKLPPLKAVSQWKVQHHGTPIVQFWKAGGQLVAASRPVPELALQRSTGFHTVETAGRSWRVYTAAASPMRVQVVASNDFRQRVIWDSAWKSAKPILLLIPFTVALLWLAIYLALRPLDRLAGIASRQDERTLEDLPTDGVPSEILPVVTSVNGLLRRLRNAFEAQQHFVQDAAHELRTPLTALKLQAENLHSKLTGSAEQEWVALESGIRRVQRLVEQLLQLTRQESVGYGREAATVNLRELLTECIGDLASVADQQRIEISVEAGEGADAPVDAHHLRVIFDNLLDNALRYTPGGGRVDVTLRCADGMAIAEFADTGPGIPPTLLARVFDRFYRIPGSGTSGSGLGLAIAQSAAERSGVRVELSNRSDRVGLQARVYIPLTA